MSALTGEADLAARDDHRAMALGIARSMGGRACDRDDLRGAALLGLVQAARSYDESRGLPFRRWAEARVRGAVLDEMRRQGGGKGPWRGVRVLSLDREHVRAPGGEDADAPRTFGEAVPSGELPVGWEVDSEDAVEAMASRLSRHRGDVLRLLYLRASDGPSPILAAGAVLGVGESMVHRHRSRALAWLRANPGGEVA